MCIYSKQNRSKQNQQEIAFQVLSDSKPSSPFRGGVIFSVFLEQSKKQYKNRSARTSLRYWKRTYWTIILYLYWVYWRTQGIINYLEIVRKVAYRTYELNEIQTYNYTKWRPGSTDCCLGAWPLASKASPSSICRCSNVMSLPWRRYCFMKDEPQISTWQCHPTYVSPNMDNMDRSDKNKNTSTWVYRKETRSVKLLLRNNYLYCLTSVLAGHALLHKCSWC